MAVEDDGGATRRAGWLVALLVGLALMPVGAAARDAGWRHYEQRYMTDDGRVVDTGNGGVSHTEGQGWGMLMAVYFDDRPRFEKLYQWTRQHLRRPVDGLYAWRYQPDAEPRIVDPNNATDGDLLIAWALQRAGQRWGVRRYLADSLTLREAIRRHLLLEYGGYLVLLPARSGFVHDGYVNLNPSYWVMPALDEFARLEPNGPWRRLMYDGARLMHEARFGEHRLVPDWLRLNKDGSLALPEAWPPRFGFEAVRVPLYFYWMGLGDAGALDGIRRYWMRPRPPAWVDLASGESADFTLSRGGLAVRALLLGNGDSIPLSPGGDDDYYSASLLMLSRMAWRPHS
ncbi:glycosyl hydrolase family 8 [Alloalcanivorax sp. C16-1]|uniref:glycosyl hydrolase family 8 n=1 Tax=Alloalcanivorax sp. C16-1 TaxID=3390051 RepID=UPI0039704F0B